MQRSTIRGAKEGSPMKRIIILAFAAALIISACGKEAPAPQTVTVTLKSNPTTGYSWQVSQTEELFQVSRSYLQNEHPEGMVGAGGNETFKFIPLKTGRTEVTLTYARPWEGGEQADQVVYVFEIDHDLQVKMINGYSTGVDEPIPAPTPSIK